MIQEQNSLRQNFTGYLR